MYHVSNRYTLPLSGFGQNLDSIVARRIRKSSGRVNSTLVLRSLTEVFHEESVELLGSWITSASKWSERGSGLFEFLFHFSSI